MVTLNTKVQDALIGGFMLYKLPDRRFFSGGGGRSGGFWVARALAYKKAKLSVDFYDNKTDCSRKVQSI